MFLKRLGISLPIVQAPMAGVSTPSMAAAVSNAGGLGSIAIGASDPAKARAAIRQVRHLTKRPFNVNVFVHADPIVDPAKERRWLDTLRPEFERFGSQPPTSLRTIYTSFASDEAMLDVLLEEKPPIVSFHFGLPSQRIISKLKEAGTVLFATATSLAEGRSIEESGVDVIVAQGIEGGGHRGVFDPQGPDSELGILALTRLLVSNCRLPVIASGGIMDGAGIRAVLDLGAIAAQLGTAFVACPESDADEGYRKLLAGEAAERTRMVSGISGRPARSLANRWTELGLTDAPAYPIAYDAGKQLHALAKSKGNWGYGAYWAGQGAPLSRPMPAEELILTLAKELAETR